MMPQRNQETDSNNGVNLVEVWGSWIRVKKFDFYTQISEKFQFFQAILQKNINFCRQISEKFDFFRQLKKFDFPSKKFSIYSYLWANYSISLQSNHFRTYLLYMIRYNNIS